MSHFSAAFDWARHQVKSDRLPSAVLGIATADGTVALDAFGASGPRTATVDDHYALFSITKPLVGLVAARAIERGLLTPQTPLVAAIPEFGSLRDDVVRLRHLVSHTSGITEPPLDPVAGLRESLLVGSRDFAAGAASRYSSIAYEGVAALIEQATGQSWIDGVSKWANEIGADGFTVDPACDAHPVADAGAAGLDVDRFQSLQHPGAGMFARASDLLALGSTLLRRDGVVQPATLEMMLRPLTGDVPRLEPYPVERGQDWGFSWNLRRHDPALISTDGFGHGGWAGTEFWVHPTAGVTYVLLTNQALRPGVDTAQLDNAIVSGV
ncbi:CubicO group peptidase (beta-lactamase class C family) [Microbacterium halimionae]|uniref:CubicO group peptidase (Beta-lactamase class C family) n=1 Tax=Microbacterium halimionae TaxID=1526413 RepID=A0A7W3JQM8_9MICO|nr:serine hydrolase domain-containing protein [Microbacterium halimionae]MBA8817222.1 CubicO group peptidase (beta-lactamase class C family) [Microbacterium halimionae]NII94672.1 CubicO group peptidase (beta-lactamase class C family) [Microbacterium halimionae]